MDKVTKKHLTDLETVVVARNGIGLPILKTAGGGLASESSSMINFNQALDNPKQFNRAGTAILPDGFPATGFVRPIECYRPIGPLPMSRATFWARVRALNIEKFRPSPRVTMFAVSSIREKLMRKDPS